MTIVTVNDGKLRGAQAVTDSGKHYYEFLCVPYAQPPVGELRFKNPVPPTKWDDIRDATKFSEKNICYQLDPAKCDLVGSEDCLYLNVFTPRLPAENSKLLPVMFFIHGGGFVFGNGIVKSELGPDYLIENDVVFVSINYRLGIFGFLSLDIPEVSGNMGLKDQVLALKWVQDNIKYFGGDKNNVTVFGISAGSASVEYLIMSPLGRGLFHKCILQSGSSLNHWAINYEPKKILYELLRESDYQGSLNDVNVIHEYLLKAPTSELYKNTNKAIKNLNINRVFCGFVPTIEKDFGNGDAFITKNPYRVLKEGSFNRIPVIKGFCNLEGYLSYMWKSESIQNLTINKDFVSYLPYEIENNFIKYLQSQFQTAYSEKVPISNLDKVAVDFFGHLDFIAGIWISGKIMASNENPVYFYSLCYDGNMNSSKVIYDSKKSGCSHGDDLAYIFKHDIITKKAQDKDVRVRTNVTKMWTNFAKTSNPTPNDDDKTLKWLPYTEDSPAYLKIDDEISIIESNYEPAKMQIFEEIYEKYEI